MKMTGSSSGADLRNGEQKVVAAVSEKSSAIPPPDRSQIMDTLSGLFDKSGSFAGGLLGLRKMRLTSMPSFRVGCNEYLHEQLISYSLNHGYLFVEN